MGDSGPGRLGRAEHKRQPTMLQSGNKNAPPKTTKNRKNITMADIAAVPGLADFASYMDESEQALTQMLIANGQAHLFAAWKAGEDVAAKHAFFEQVRGLERGYPGGVAQYVANAKKLLQDSAADANPFEGYTPRVRALCCGRVWEANLDAAPASTRRKN